MRVSVRVGVGGTPHLIVFTPIDEVDGFVNLHRHRQWWGYHRRRRFRHWCSIVFKYEAELLVGSLAILIDPDLRILPNSHLHVWEVDRTQCITVAMMVHWDKGAVHRPWVLCTLIKLQTKATVAQKAARKVD